MRSWLLYPVILGALLSVAGWSLFVYRTYDANKHFTLSEFGAQTPRTIFYFRLILWVCGPLFALTMFGYVAPVLHNSLLRLCLGLAIAGEMLLGLVLPTGGKATTIHQSLAALMGCGMIGSTACFIYLLNSFREVQLFCLLGMVGLSLYAIIITHRRKFVFYELCFIFLSHLSLVLAALSATDS